MWIYLIPIFPRSLQKGAVSSGSEAEVAAGECVSVCVHTLAHSGAKSDQPVLARRSWRILGRGICIPAASTDFMNPPLQCIRAQPQLPQGLLWLMFGSFCIRVTGWKLLSFSAVLYHVVNWLTGSDWAAKTKGRQPKWAPFSTSLPFPPPL